MEILSVYAIGAGIYALIELMWRGWTHWTMLLCGGACFTFMYLISGTALPMLAKCLICAAFISALELGVGYLVNIIFGWHIWDYSDRPFNLMGQICPLYCLFWLALSLPGLAVCRQLRQLIA